MVEFILPKGEVKNGTENFVTVYRFVKQTPVRRCALYGSCRIMHGNGGAEGEGNPRY